MYNFVDTTPGSGTGSTSLSLQTVFNGINFDKLLTDENGSFTTLTVSGRSNLTQRINTINIPGLDGALEEGNPTIDSRRITVKFMLSDKINEGFRKRLNQLNSMLEGSKKVLKFTDEDALFYATFETLDVPEEESNNLICSLIFFCSDPYKYGPEITHPFQSDVLTVPNNGTAPANPIFELEVLAPITYAMIQNQNGEYMMIGRPVDLENQVPFQKYERIFHSNGSTDVGWTDYDSVDGGSVSGKMETNGTRFQAADYGTGTSWHGPAIKTSLTEVLTDFRLETIIGFWNAQANQVGRVEIYLLDANDNAVGKLSMKDTQSGRAMAVGEIRAGDILENNYLINGPATRDDGWNDFYGMLRLEREGDVWKAYIGKIDQTTGNHHWRQAFEWTDFEGKYKRTVAQVAIHVGRFGTYASGAMGIYEVSVYKINQQPDGVPYIADVGDKITFDHTKNGEVLINGEPFEDIDFGADFFKFSKGENQLVSHPSNAFSTKARFREPFR